MHKLNLRQKSGWVAPMTDCLAKFTLLSAMLLPLEVAAEEGGVQADVLISAQQDQDIWVGQQLTVNLDLKTTGFSFSDSYFNLPEVPGAFLMQTDTTTVKITETVNGQNWQILRFPLALYPQKAGRLVIPPIAVRFSTSAGFGRTSLPFEFHTKPLKLDINLPPGVNAGDWVISTTSFKLDYQWLPESGEARTGDAVTLTVKRRANEISAMLLPALPVYHADGVAAYPQVAELNDISNRGDLTGERLDRIIWVFEKPGSYDIPGIRFQWWDPGIRKLEQQVIPGLKLLVTPSAEDKSRAAASVESEQAGSNFRWLLIAILAVTGAIVVAWRKLLRQQEDVEKTVFYRLQKACNSNDVGQAHTALHSWILMYSPPGLSYSRPLTLNEFAQTHGNRRLAAQMEQLQESLIEPDSHWQGGELLDALQGVRRTLKEQKSVRSKTQLAPLNP